jgi:hypothetical protein
MFIKGKNENQYCDEMVAASTLLVYDPEASLSGISKPCDGVTFEFPPKAAPTEDDRCSVIEKYRVLQYRNGIHVLVEAMHTAQKNLLFGSEKAAVAIGKKGILTPLSKESEIFRAYGLRR